MQIDPRSTMHFRDVICTNSFIAKKMRITQEAVDLPPINKTMCDREVYVL